MKVDIDITARKAAPYLVVMLLVSVITGGVAAAAVWDTGTTNSPETSDVTSSSHTETYNSTGNLYVAVDNAGTTNLTLEIRPDSDAIETPLYTNSSGVVLNSSTNNVAWNLSHSAVLNEIAHGKDAGHYDLVVVNKSGAVKKSADLTVDYSGQNGSTVIMSVVSAGAPGLDELADSSTISTKDGLLSGVFGNDSTTTASWNGYMSVNANTTEQVKFVNDSTASTYDSLAADAEDGTWMTQTVVFMNGVPYQVYDGSPSETPGHHYAVYDESTDTLTFKNNADHLENTTIVRVRGQTHTDYAFTKALSHFGFNDAMQVAF